MATPIPRGRPARDDRRPTDGLTRQQRRERDDRTAVYAFLWILFGFKAATALTIWLVAARSNDAGYIISATHWFWLIFPVLAVAGPLVYQLRIRRVRRRRAALQRAEWLVEPAVTHRPVDAETRRAALHRSEWMLD